MNFLLTVCAAVAFLTYYHQRCHAIEFDLDAFMKNFEKSQSDLKWIRDESHKNEGKELADAKESNLDEDDESSVDHWYNKYRKWECSTDHGDQESKVVNGYCGVNDDNYPKQNKFAKSNSVKPAADPKTESNLKDTKFEITDTDSMSDNSDNFDDFHEDFDQQHFDVNSDNKLSPEEKLDLEEYNEQMIPNPNFYKIHNELHATDQQINKDHNEFRNELGFSPALSNYPSSADDIYTHIDYGNENNVVDGQDIKTKRNTMDFDASPKTNFDRFSYSQLNDQDDNRKNDLSHEADYKLSKNEQESQSKPESSDKHITHESQIEQRIQNEPKYKFQNEFRNGYKPQNEVRNNFQDEHSSDPVAHYNNFKEINEPITDFNKNSRLMASNAKPNVYSKKQSKDSKPQKYLSRHGKSNQLANEINLKISNRMMSKGLGPSLPSQSVNYNPSSYRHPMNIDVENQHWRNRRDENSDDLTDFIGLQRRLLQFDYEDRGNDYPLHEGNNAVSEKESPKNGFLQVSNAKPLVNNVEILNTAVTNSSETIDQKETTTEKNTTKAQQDHPKIEPITKYNQSETNNTLQTGHVDSVKLQLKIEISNATTKVRPVGDHGKIVKRSAAHDKVFGAQE